MDYTQWSEEFQISRHAGPACQQAVGDVLPLERLSPIGFCEVGGSRSLLHIKISPHRIQCRRAFSRAVTTFHEQKSRRW